MHRVERRRWEAALLLVGVLALCGCDTAHIDGTGSPAVAASASDPTHSSTSSATDPSPPYSASSSSSAATPLATPSATTSSPPVSSPAAMTTTSAPAAPTTHAPAPVGQALPLALSTGSASQVVTVVVASSQSTTATVQAWNEVAGGRWQPETAAVTGHVGADGVGTASETRSTTPAGSFTLTQAFGHDANPGTRLPYFQTTPADWWISQEGPLYNTHQHCSISSAACGFTLGNPNEHLYYETPFYDYAVVIDYNTADAGPVVRGAGSAFFLHVTDGTPTAGCVAIPQSTLVAILRWLTPADHPRILIGVG